MLTFNLKKQWFNKIKSGEKTHEYREVKPCWTGRFIAICSAIEEDKNKRIYPPIKTEPFIEPTYYINCCFKLGYPKDTEKDKILYGYIKSIEVINGKDTDLKIDKDVYDIEFKLIKEQTNERN